MLSNQLKSGAILSYVLIGLSNLVGILYTPYLLRSLGQSEYGLYSLVASVIAYLTILDFGFGNAIVRYTSKFRAEGETAKQYSMFGMFIIIYTIIGLIAFSLGLLLYSNIDYFFGVSLINEELGKAKIMIIIMIINLAFTFPLSIFGSIIIAYENFIFQKVIQILRILLNTIVMIVLLYYGYKAITLVLVLTFFNLLTLLINVWFCFYKIRIKIFFKNFEWMFLKEIGIYSFYIFLTIIMDRIYWSSGQFILGVYIGTAAVAVFAIAIQLQAMYMSLSTAISGVFLPRVTAMVTKKSSDTSISNLFIKIGRLQFIVMAFILSGFILFGKQFISLWAGEGYEDVYIISLLFFIPLTVPLIQNLGITILEARNQIKFRSILYAIIATTSLCFQIPLAKYYGPIGCAIGIAFSLILGQIIIMNIYYHKRQKINIIMFWKEIGKMSILPILIGIAGYLMLTIINLNSIFIFFIAILIYTIIYVPLLWYFSINNYERKLAKDLLFKVSKKIKKNYENSDY